MSAFVYILHCADRSYYVGLARGETLDKRIGEHQDGEIHGYTSTRRPRAIARSSNRLESAPLS